jgi:hypothetical protein
VPIGAPVRVGITLANLGDRPIAVPEDLGLKGEFVSGRVIDPSGTVRSFRTVVRCVEDHQFVEIDPGDSRKASMTLMRGAEGALFGAPGLHEVQVDVHWEIDGMTAHVTGSSTVMVTPVQDEVHAAAARHVLSTPDAHLVLAIGGDHMTEGIAAVQAALESPVLRPHFAAIEAKRVGRRFGKRKPDFKKVDQLVDESTVMSGDEVGKLALIAADNKAVGDAAKQLTRALKSKAKNVPLSDAAKKALDAI